MYSIVLKSAGWGARMSMVFLEEEEDASASPRSMGRPSWRRESVVPLREDVGLAAGIGTMRLLQYDRMDDAYSSRRGSIVDVVVLAMNMLCVLDRVLRTN